MRHLRLRFGRASSRLALGLAALTLVSLVSASDARAQARVDRNVVYGMFSGLALLMDVHRPETPNGYGAIFVAGSAWSAPLAYGAGGLKEAQIGDWAVGIS